MSREEIDTAIDWAATEGWNPGLHDADCFYTADPTGFFMGKIGDTPVATMSAVRYGTHFGFAGLYIVKPEYRKKGYGIQIWNKCLDYLAERTIGLDGVAAQQDNYKKSGFRFAHRNMRFAGTSKTNQNLSQNIKTLSVDNFSSLHKYDRNFFPADRENFLKKWIAQPGSFSFGFFTHEKLQGYGVIRACRSGYKIGPLNAETPTIAHEILIALTSRIPAGTEIYLDTPEPNTEAIDLAHKHGMQCSFETARMYAGEFPELPLQKIFSITSFELG